MFQKSLQVLCILSQGLMMLGCAQWTPRSTEETRLSKDGAYENLKYRSPSSVNSQNTFSPSFSAMGEIVQKKAQADYLYSLGEALSLDGNSLEAIEKFKESLIYDEKASELYLRLGAEYLKAGRILEALEQGEEALKKDPESAKALLFLGNIYAGLKFYDKAIDQYSLVLKKNPQNPEALVFIGALYSELKQYSKALEMFERLSLLEEYESTHIAWYYMGRIYGEQKGLSQFKKAEDSFRKALKLKPQFYEAALGWAQLYVAKSQNALALGILDEYSKESGDRGPILEVQAQLALQLEKYSLALEYLVKREKTEDMSFELRMKMALLFIELKKYPEAISRLKEIIELEPGSDKAPYYLAAIYEELNEKELAIDWFAKISSNSEYYVESAIHRAYLLKNLGKTSQAQEILEKTLSQKKGTPQAYILMASIYEEKNNYEAGIVSLKQGLELYAENAALLYFYGTYLDRQPQQRDEVVKILKKVIEIDSKHFQALNYLAFIFAENGERLKEAESLAYRAVKIEPKDPYVLDTLGWVYYKQGKYNEAAQWLEKAMKIEEGARVSVILEHLGDVYMKKQMISKALEMYNRALENSNETVKKAQLEVKISALLGGTAHSHQEEKRDPATFLESP